MSGGGLRRAGFTLLEVMVATMILGMLTFAIHRFVTTTLRAIDATTVMSEERSEVTSVTRIVQSLLNDLPMQRPGMITGKANKFHDLSADELTWITRSGPGVMTGAAPGEYRVTLTVQPSEKDVSVLELGLRRELVTADEKSEVDFFTRGGSDAKYNWLPLIKPIAALEIRYWDPRNNSLLSKWTDPNARPSFVQLKIWKQAGDLPVDVIMPIPSSRMQQTP
jgi:prepilin-type N-terminal cleavage/methylation domain-containing protein